MVVSNLGPNVSKAYLKDDTNKCINSIKNMLTTSISNIYVLSKIPLEENTQSIPYVIGF